jgi:hypothetical protein
MSFGGLLNDTCTIYNRVVSVDADTGEQIYTQVIAAQNVPCALQHSGGGLDRDSRLAKEDNSDRLYMFPPTVTITKMETVIEVRGNKYRVREIIDMGGRKRYTRLDLERYSVNG